MADGKFTKDLTTGSVWRGLILFAIPLFISNLIQSVYSVADMMILGHFCGTEGISAVNTSSQVIVIITNLAMGIATGGTVMIGQFLGAGQMEKIKKSISTLLISLLVLAIVITTILLILTKPMLDLLNTPSDSYEGAKDYLVINLVGLIFVFGYNALSAIMRGLGDSKTPLLFVIIASITNIVLDFILIGVYEKGAAGAAYATIFSQALSMLLCIIYLKSHNFMFDFKLKSFIFDSKCFKNLMEIGLPNGIQMVATNFSFLILTGIINDIGGDAANAASGIVNKFNGFAILPCVAVMSSISAMISQNMGARKEHRTKQATNCGLLLICIICAVIYTIANIFPEEIFHIFDAEPDVITVGIIYIHAFAFEYVFLPLNCAYNAVFTGTGNGWITLVINIVASFIVRIPLAYLLTFGFDLGIKGIGYSIPAATCVGSVMALIFYLSGVWKKNKVELNA